MGATPTPSASRFGITPAAGDMSRYPKTPKPQAMIALDRKIDFSAFNTMSYGGFRDHILLPQCCILPTTLDDKRRGHGGHQYKIARHYFHRYHLIVHCFAGPLSLSGLD